MFCINCFYAGLWQLRNKGLAKYLGLPLINHKPGKFRKGSSQVHTFQSFFEVMGKNKFLDDADKPQTMSCMSYLKCRLTHILLLGCCLLLFSSCCVLPKIIVLEDPLTSEEHLELGAAYEKKGEFDGAIKQYRLAAKKLPVAYLYLGNAHFQKNELHEAEEF